MHFFYGVFTPYNYIVARYHIAIGKPEILQYGEPMLTDRYAIAIAPMFGFEYKIVAGCIISSPLTNGINAYNAATTDYLNKKMGKKWKEQFDFQVDSLFHAGRTDEIRKEVLKIEEVKQIGNYLDSISGGKRKIHVWILPQKKKEANVRVGEVMMDSSFKIFYYYHVDAFTLQISRIRY